MTRDAIRSLARFYLNEATAGFWSDADLNTLINLANQVVNDLINRIRKDFFTTSATIVTSNGTQSYALATDFKTLRRVEHYDPNDASDIQKIDEIVFPNIEKGGNWPSDRPSRPKRYWVIASTIYFLPIPDGLYNIRYYYDNRRADLAATDEPSSPAEFHDLLAVWTAMEALIKNGETSQVLAAKWADRREALIQMLATRRGEDVETVQGYLEGWD